MFFRELEKETFARVSNITRTASLLKLLTRTFRSITIYHILIILIIYSNRISGQRHPSEMFNILACEENPLIAWVHCSEWVWQTQHKPEEVSARIQTSSLRQNLMVRNPSWTSWTSWTTEQEQTRLTHWVCQADTPFHPLVITMFIHVPCQNCHTIWRWNIPFSDTPKYHLGCMSQHIPSISHQFPCEIPMNSDPPPACSVHFRPLGQQTCPSSKALLNRIASKLQNPIGWSSDISDIIGYPIPTWPFLWRCIGKSPTLRRWTPRKPSRKVSATPAYALANPELEFHRLGS